MESERARERERERETESEILFVREMDGSEGGRTRLMCLFEKAGAVLTYTTRSAGALVCSCPPPSH